MSDPAPSSIALTPPGPVRLPDVVLRRGFHLWPLDAVTFVVLAVAVPAALVGTGAYPYSYLPLLAVLVWKLVRRPKVTLGAAGVGSRGRTVPWHAITAVEDFAGARSRYVRMLVDGAWVRVPALRTSRLLPGRAYRSRVDELARYLKAFSAQTTVVDREHNRWTQAYVALLVLLLVGLVYAEDPAHYWLPHPEVVTAPGPCDVGRVAAKGLGLAPTKLTGGQTSDIGVTTSGCEFWGDTGAATVVIQTCARIGVVSGTGVAHLGFEDSVLHTPGPNPFGVSVPADEWGIVAIVPAGQHDQFNVVVHARKANVLVTVIYTSRHDTIVTWTGNTVVAATDHADVSGAVAIAGEALNEITVDGR